MKENKILIIIPARGGSKGIPRKNIRLLNSKPLIYYSIKTALSSRHNVDVYLSSDDEEILNFGNQFGVKTHKRSSIISDDKNTLDPVIYECYEYVKVKEKKDYEYIVTLQPTSPLLKVKTLDEAIEKALSNKEIETIISAKEDTHLSWEIKNYKYIPKYVERLNRQYLPKSFKETGAFFITRQDILTDNNRIGQNVELQILSNGEEIDIDTFEDWNLCEYYLKKKHILFVVTGNNEVGLGHVYNTLLLANDILDHKITFLVDKNSEMALKKLKSNNYNVLIQRDNNILHDINLINPDLVINDILDTSKNYILALKEKQYKVINFEDLGEGSEYADAVINAIYPEKRVLKNHFFGHKYFLLRDEFIYSEKKAIKKLVKEVLITFGGVDPNNYTLKVLESIYDLCIKKDIKINIVTGFGYKNSESLKKYKKINLLINVQNISKYIFEADIIFTSAGRTTYEIASIGTPAIVLAQNSRELTHFFASEEYGFVNLGLGYNNSNKKIKNVFFDLVESKSKRTYINNLMQKNNLFKGRNRVNQIIRNILKEI